MSKNIQVPQGWEVKKLGEVFKKVTEKNIHLKINTVLTNSAQFGVIPQNEFFDKSIATKENIDNYYILEMDNFIYNSRISKFAPAGPISRNKYGIGCVSPLYTVFKIHSDNNINFYEFYFKSNLWNRQAYNIANFGARFDRMNITDKDFFNMPIPVPPLEEQEKIADILSLWDKAIEQTKELIAYKEKQKKGLMQALLTVKKRLQGFTDEWKTVKLGECFKNFGGAPLEKYMNIASKYKFISIGNYSTQGKYIDNGNRIILNDITQTKLLNKNDLVMVLNDKTADGKIIGATILIDEDNTYIYNQRSERLVCNKNVFPLFFWFLLNSELIRKEIFAMAQGGTQIYINFSSIKSIKIFLPPLDEQKAIADILSSADEEIQLLNKQLELYTEQKKGLMQNLLTGKVRV